METSDLAKIISDATAVHFTLERCGTQYILRVEDGHHNLCYSHSYSEPLAAMQAAERLKEEWRFGARMFCA